MCPPARRRAPRPLPAPLQTSCATTGRRSAARPTLWRTLPRRGSSFWSTAARWVQDLQCRRLVPRRCPAAAQAVWCNAPQALRAAAARWCVAVRACRHAAGSAPPTPTHTPAAPLLPLPCRPQPSPTVPTDTRINVTLQFVDACKDDKPTQITIQAVQRQCEAGGAAQNPLLQPWQADSVQVAVQAPPPNCEPAGGLGGRCLACRRVVSATTVWRRSLKAHDQLQCWVLTAPTVPPRLPAQTPAPPACRTSLATRCGAALAPRMQGTGCWGGCALLFPALARHATAEATTPLALRRCRPC